MEARRIHHQLVPMRIDYEEGLDPAVLAELGKVGHKFNQVRKDGGFASVTAIARQMGGGGGPGEDHGNAGHRAPEEHEHSAGGRAGRRSRRSSHSDGSGAGKGQSSKHEHDEIEILVPNFDSRRWGSKAVLELKTKPSPESEPRLKTKL